MALSIPRLSFARPSGHVDVAIIGAGAAGIAAARVCAAAGLSVAVLEARRRVGGRAVTAMAGGHPVDLGAHWLHAGTLNPLVRLGLAGGASVRRAPGESHLVVRGRRATPGERAAHGRGFGLMERAFADAARADEDRSALDVAPLLGRWRQPVLATHALISGRPLGEVSTKDYPSDEFGDNYFVAGGYGAYIARLARGLPIALGEPVRVIDTTGAGVSIETVAGARIEARAAVLTVPVPLLQAGGITFRPGLPESHRDALAGFLAGTYEHVILNWPDLPLRGADRLAKLVGRRDAIGMLTHIDGAPVHYMELDHALATRLPNPAATARFARAFLAEHFGGRALSRLQILGVTDWRADPWSRCSWAVVPPGRHTARAALRVPVADRLWFAGEATSDGQWGTAGGAWEEGERAATDVIGMLHPGETPHPPRTPLAAQAETH
jgi:monoamine oxidase